MAEDDASEGALSKGWCQNVVNGRKGAEGSYLQVIGVIKGGTLVRLLLHDGRDCMEVTVATQARVAAENLKKGAIIQADHAQYTCQTMGNKRTAMFKDLTIIQDECELLDPCNENAPAPHFGANKLNQDAVAGSAPATAPSPLFGNNRNKKHKSSPFMSNPVQRRIAAGSGGPGSAATPIANLNPYMTGCTIKGRCTEKGDMRSWENAKGKGTLFNFTLLDDSGEIKVTAFKHEAEKWFNVVTEGEVYTLQRGRIKLDSYSKKYAITMTRETLLDVAKGERDTFTKKQYDFKTFKEINAMEIPESGPKARVDTMCIIKSIGERQEFTARNEKNYVKRDVICVDESGIEMSVTMWGSQADEFTPETKPAGTVLVLPQASVSSFGGRTLSAQKVIEKFDEYPRAVRLKQWWKSGGSDQEFKQVSVAKTSFRRSEYTTFAEAKAQNKGLPPSGITGAERDNYKGDWITLNGCLSLIRINEERPPWYLSEPEGRKKVDDIGGGKYQNREGAEFDSYNCKWLVRFKFADFTQAEWCTSFDEVGETIMGTSAKEMEAVYKTDYPAAEKYFRDRQFSEWTVSIQCKEEVYNDEARMRYRCNGIEELDYVKDTNRMKDDQSFKDWLGILA